MYNLIMQLDLNIPDILLIKDKQPQKLEYLPDDCVVIDIETTGLNPVKDSIIEISGIKVKNGKAVEEFSSLINPNRKIPKFITGLTGISDDMLKDARDAKEVLTDFCSFIQTEPIVGHNIRFDLSFINANLKKYFNLPLINDYADTLTFSRKFYNLPSYKLTKIAEYLNIDTKNAHRALQDCYMAYYVMQDIKSKK